MANKIIVSHSSLGIGYVYKEEINNPVIDLYPIKHNFSVSITNTNGLKHNQFLVIPSLETINELLNETYENKFSNITAATQFALQHHNKGRELKIEFSSPTTLRGMVYEEYKEYFVSYDFKWHKSECTCKKINCQHAYFLLNKTRQVINKLLNDIKIDLDLKDFLSEITYQ